MLVQELVDIFRATSQSFQIGVVVVWCALLLILIWGLNKLQGLKNDPHSFWIRYINKEYAAVRKFPRNERANHYRQLYARLYRELSNETAGGPEHFNHLSTAERSIWIYLLERQRGVLYFSKV